MRPKMDGLPRLLCAAVALVAVAEVVSGGQPRRLQLADPRMAATPAARSTLAYLASCALDANSMLVAQHDGRTYEFPGAIGLAPAWQARAMTVEEQRWVSACMLARTNLFGVTVTISMRSGATSLPALQASREEVAGFALHEGTFFGNLFAQKPVSYVCGPNHDAPVRNWIASLQRVCALKQTQSRGGNLTACGIVHVGPCDAQVFDRDGVRYQEAIAVYLPARSTATPPR